MMMNEFIGLRGTLRRNAPIARHTTWRAGGCADLLYAPADRDDLAQFVHALPPALPLTVLGLGSNVLVRDGGIRGAVVLMHDPGAVLADVYPAGEAPIVAADGRALARAVRVAGRVEPVFVEAIADMAEAIRGIARDGDVVLTMGAGSIGSVPAQLGGAR